MPRPRMRWGQNSPNMNPFGGVWGHYSSTGGASSDQQNHLSMAVEFDDGLDLSYQWSSALPPETAYQCPFPHWSNRETHLVVRSGTRELGRWLREERRVYTDRSAAIGAGTRGASPGSGSLP